MFIIHDALCNVQLHKIKSISVKNIFKIEKHQLHLSFVCTMTTTLLLYAATVAATSIYITNIHKIHWLIMHLSMPSRVDLYEITARMLHAIQMWQFKSKNLQKGNPKWEIEKRPRQMCAYEILAFLGYLSNAFCHDIYIESCKSKCRHHCVSCCYYFT